MKPPTSHNFYLSTVAASLTLLVLALSCLRPGASLAQQDNRQLKRESVEPRSAQPRRAALVIGNGAYTNAPPLKNPPNDARDMAATLKVLGFEVVSGTNVNQREMKRLIREFGQTLKAGGSGLFYYAGHGVQSKGHNYLVPVDAEVQSEAELEDSGVDVNLVLNYMDDAQNGLNIVVLDACRNNPFTRSFRSASSGLAQVDAPTGTLIAYATAPGSVAADGTGQNGIYTSELLRQMQVPGLSVSDMFMRVRAEVMKQTGNKQVPWESSSLVGVFYFRGPAKNDSNSIKDADANRTKVDPAAIELVYWESIKNSNNSEDFKAYLEKYPSGQFASLARNRISRLTKPDESKQTSDPGRVTNDIGQKKSNGSYEITLENVTFSDSTAQYSCSSTVQAHETAAIVRFTIKALNNSVSAYTRKAGDTDFVIVNQDGRRFERVCGDGWYGWGARTITLVYVVPKKVSDPRFTFQNVGHGDAISFAIPKMQ